MTNNNIYELREPHRPTPTTPLPSSDCPAWCGYPADEPNHVHRSPRRTFRDVDADGDVLCAFTVCAAQPLADGAAWVDLRAWHAGDPGQPPSEVEALLSPAEARELAGMLIDAAEQAGQLDG
jgi:hypothetical protein